MKLIIFAGGHGTRLWPLSRKNSPKQFERMFEGKSTLQLAFDRVKSKFGTENVYVSTNKSYKNLVAEQLPDLPKENLFLEPAKRDLAAAIGLSLFRLKAQNYSGPIAILWADHLMKNVDEFVNAIALGGSLIEENSNRFIFLGEKPRFANHNLGWITVGEEIDKKENISIREFKSWKYRPPLEECRAMFEAGNSLWNPGYWVTSINFVLSLYEEHMNEMYLKLTEMVENDNLIEEVYPTLESISFDNAIVEKAKPDQAVVLSVDLGWSDPGTLYALKEALQESQTSNITMGKTYALDTEDSLLINQDEHKLLTTIGLSGFVVVNTKDAIVVVHKDNVPKVKDIVGKLEEEGQTEFI